MVRETAVRVACMAIIFIAAASGTNVRGQQYNLDSLLVGKWHQEYGALITETLFSGGRPHEFIALTVQRGTSYRFCVQGEWEIRSGNQLWQHNLRWIPDNVRVPEWEGAVIEVVDANHLRNKAGDVFRISGGMPCPP